MKGAAQVRADLAEIQAACDRAHAALLVARVAQVAPGRPVRGLEQVTRIAAAAAATLLIAVLVRMNG